MNYNIKNLTKAHAIVSELILDDQCCDINLNLSGHTLLFQLNRIEGLIAKEIESKTKKPHGQIRDPLMYGE